MYSSRTMVNCSSLVYLFIATVGLLTWVTSFAHEHIYPLNYPPEKIKGKPLRLQTNYCREETMSSQAVSGGISHFDTGEYSRAAAWGRQMRQPALSDTLYCRDHTGLAVQPEYRQSTGIQAEFGCSSG